jgi:hypothetical protein
MNNFARVWQIAIVPSDVKNSVLREIVAILELSFEE